MRLAPLIATLVAAAALALAGCTPIPTPPTEPPSPPPTTSTAPTTSEGTDMRSRLACALEPTSPDTATMIRDEQRTKLTEVPAKWLTGWVLIDVLHYAPNHPRRLYVALSDDDTATVLTGKPEGFNAVVAGGTKPTERQAFEIANTFLVVTRDFKKWSYQIGSVHNIEWLPKLNADQAKERDQLIKKFEDRISTPRPAAVDDGWVVTLWTVTGTNLVQNELLVRADRTVQATPIVVAEDMPVPDSM